MNILYAALQRLPVAVVVLVITVGAGWHLLPILAGVGLLVGASERFILHRRLRDLDDEIADLTAADAFRRDLRGAITIPSDPNTPEHVADLSDAHHDGFGAGCVRRLAEGLSRSDWRIHLAGLRTNASRAWHLSTDVALVPVALVFAWWDARHSLPDVDAPLVDADDLGYLTAPIWPFVDERDTRSSAAVLIAHLHAIRGETWAPRGDSGEVEEIGRHSGEALARNDIHGAPTQRRPSAAANQRLIINALWSPTQELSVIGDDDLHYFLAELLDANTQAGVR